MVNQGVFDLSLLGQRSLSKTTVDKLDEISKKNFANGFRANMECISVLRVAIEYLGTKYLRTEELAETSIDCSTLTSQSFWEGACIGIPFVADNQRKAKSGKEIGLSQIQPGDVVTKYQSIGDAPDKQFNHVGLFIGWDLAGEPWVIESNSKDGCVISTLHKFDPQGGIRRFCLNSYDEFNLDAIRKASILVPKFGRLGVKQYSIDGKGRFPHLGVDIYLPPRSPILAPIEGVIGVENMPRENGCMICIVNHDNQSIARLGHVELFNKELLGETILAGELVGNLVAPPKNSEIHYSEIHQDQVHLHFELEVRSGDCLNFIDGVTVNNQRYLNGLHAAKLGKIEYPIVL